MRKNICLLMVACTAALSLSACGKDSSTEETTTIQETTTTPETTTAANKAEYETLSNETINKASFEGTDFEGDDYTIKVKNNFVKRETSGIDFFQIEGTNTQISISKDTVGMADDLDGYLSGLTETFDSIDGYDAVSAGYIVLNNYNGIVINYTFSGGSDNSSTIYGRQIVLDCDGDFYALTYSTVDADFDESAVDAMEIFSTFTAK